MPAAPSRPLNIWKNSCAVYEPPPKANIRIAASLFDHLVGKREMFRKRVCSKQFRVPATTRPDIAHRYEGLSHDGRFLRREAHECLLLMITSGRRSTSRLPRRWQRPGLARSTLPQRGLPLTKCRGRAAIGPARRNPNSPQALPEEFDPP